MGRVKNYQYEFVERTLKMLECGYPIAERSEIEVTFLMNCLLGLIVTVYEHSGSNPALKGIVDEEFLRVFPGQNAMVANEPKANLDLIGKDSVEIPISRINDAGSIQKRDIIRLIRNGIAHQNIEAINEEGRWVGVKIWNLQGSRKTFEVIFTILELKGFAIFLARKYLSSIEQSNG